MTHSSAKLKKNQVSYTSLKYTPVTQSILCFIFLVYVRTVQCSNYGGKESNKQVAVYISDKHVTLKQSQGHQIYNENIHPELG